MVRTKVMKGKTAKLRPIKKNIVPIKYHSISSPSYSPQLQQLLYIFFIGADSVIKRVGVVNCEIEMLIYAFCLLRISLSLH